MQTPYTNETALEHARRLAEVVGLAENQLPTTVFADVLNGLAECEAILARMPQQETPPPVTKHVPEWLP
ncbi:MAG: hypothetical protein OXH08_13975 [Gammaproteobacteria bacterium]|nr:hypothetical protein [Gammaproteobacteria bacterium]MDE0359075.1 hypothetical protein [Gammaproteobacteria bacterium]MDE0649989.1 hypothetical protein [Gammaproteobacteria bacterium]MXW08370.1 hypothetical protein [Gammaproteobacteria bacterium]MYC52797.1 hypothetical protein [Gammaproteobacteria bacterium]